MPQTESSSDAGVQARGGNGHVPAPAISTDTSDDFSRNLLDAMLALRRER